MFIKSNAIKKPINPHPGKVRTHADTISFTTPQLTEDIRFAAPTPIKTYHAGKVGRKTLIFFKFDHVHSYGLNNSISANGSTCGHDCRAKNKHPVRYDKFCHLCLSPPSINTPINFCPSCAPKTQKNRPSRCETQYQGQCQSVKDINPLIKINTVKAFLQGNCSTAYSGNRPSPKAQKEQRKGLPGLC